jgi:hypothetical protein
MGTDCVEHWSRLGADQRNMDELGGRQVLCVAAASYGGSPMSGMEESSDDP